jgi:hypothetical protein
MSSEDVAHAQEEILEELEKSWVESRDRTGKIQ